MLKEHRIYIASIKLYVISLLVLHFSPIHGIKEPQQNVYMSLPHQSE